MKKTVVILQSNYLPWKGYFDLVHDADEFVFYDNVQFTKNDWRNRNQIKTAQGVQWITVPVGADLNRLVCDVEIKEHAWQTKHYKTLVANYGKCPYFESYVDFLKQIYLEREWWNLSELNQYLIRTISKEFLRIDTVFRDARDFAAEGQKQDRLLDILAKTGATRYLSGPAAKDYIDPQRFEDAGIELIWKDYSGYPEYQQRHPPFEHGVCILDLLFNVGPDAPWYMWGWRTSSQP